MDAPSHGAVTIYKERIREVNSALPKPKGGTEALPFALTLRERQVEALAPKAGLSGFESHRSSIFLGYCILSFAGAVGRSRAWWLRY